MNLNNTNLNNTPLIEEPTNSKTRIILYIDCFRLEFETAIDAVDFIRTYTNNFQQELLKIW